jgi:protoheme IX farnesyltransferase
MKDTARPVPPFKTYYQLTKPGIIYGNLMTCAAGFLLASKGHIDFWLLIATLAGTALIIACGCVINNYIDRGIDRKMARTKSRAIASGKVSVRNALTFGVLLGLAGFMILILYVNWLTVLVGAVGLFFYLVMYSIWKRRSVYGTIVGSVSGAMPIVAGYTGASNTFDGGAIILFFILATWQMPHFYSIAIYRFKDYAAAGLPVLPVKQGTMTARVHILCYIVAFITATVALSIFGYAGYTYLAVILLMGLGWFHLAIKGFEAKDVVRWARGMFGFSLLVITVFSILISLDAWLP